MLNRKWDMHKNIDHTANRVTISCIHILNRKWDMHGNI